MDQNEAYQSILNALENSHSDTDISDLVDPPNMDPFELVDYWTGVYDTLAENRNRMEEAANAVEDELKMKREINDGLRQGMTSQMNQITTLTQHLYGVMTDVLADQEKCMAELARPARARAANAEELVQIQQRLEEIKHRYDDDKQAAYMEKKRKEIAEEKKVLEEEKKKLAQLKAKTKAKKDEMERKKSAMIADIEAKTKERIELGKKLYNILMEKRNKARNPPKVFYSRR